ncbi:MAG: GreA/GreB family elongation factor [Kofleriaceae bacterium]
MSKAFTKEDSDVPEPPLRKRGIPVPELNFMTAVGVAAARAELESLSRAGGDPDRVHELAAHLATAQIHEPTQRDEAGIGATVVVSNEAGKRSTYRIVGAIEAEPKRGWLGWQSPLAETLFGARVGDSVVLPNGDEVEVISVGY